jgi:hypothetical protein
MAERLEPKQGADGLAGAGQSPESSSQEATPSARATAPDDAQPKSALRQPMLALGTWALGNPLSVVTALGLCLYGFLRYVYARFYGPLGVKPEEVGLGYGEILAQSVTGLLLFSALMFLLLFITAALFIIAALVWGGFFSTVLADIRRDWRNGLWYLAGLAMVILVGWAVETFGLGTLIVVWLALVAVAAVVRAIQNRSSHNNMRPDESMSTPAVTSKGKQSTTTIRRPPATASGQWQAQSLFASRGWRWSIFAAFLVTIVIVAVTLVLEAQGGATRVLRGEAWRSTFRGMPMTSMQALPATIAWSSSSPPSGLHLGDDYCLLYLGESNGITVLYDAGAHRSIRLPSSDVIVSVQNEEPACVSPK